MSYVDRPGCSWALRAGKRLSSHCVLDEDGWRGTFDIHEHGVRFRVARGFYGRVVWVRAFLDCEAAYYSLMPDWRTHVAKFVRRLQESDKVAVVGGKVTDDELSKTHPALYEHFTLDWLDGQPRTTSTVTISTGDGSWKGSLRDRENGLVLWVSGATLRGLLDALEAVLEAGDGDWRVDQYASPKSRGKQRGK